MKIKLSITGGPLGRTRSGSVEADMNEAEFEALCQQLSLKKTGRAPDSFHYFLQKEGARTRKKIDIQKIPAQYNDLFDALYKKLKYEK